jgi:hypothetical protein
MKYFRHSLIFFTIAGMEACWLYAVLSAANHSVNNVLSVPLLLSVLWVSYGVSILFKQVRWPKTMMTILSWVIWPAVMLLMVKLQLFSGLGFSDISWLSSLGHAFSQVFYKFEAPLLVFMSTSILWWMGRRLAYLELDFPATITESQVGLVALVMVFFINYELKLSQSNSSNVAIMFFFLALSGVSISHAQEDSWLFSSRRGYWLGLVLVCIGIILITGLLVSFIFTPDLIQWIIKGFQWIWSIIEKIMAFIASLFPSSTPDPGNLPPVPTIPPGNEDEGPLFKMPEWLRPGLELVWKLVVGGFLLVALWRLASQLFGWIRRHSQSSGDETENLKGAFKTDLLNFLKRLLSAVFRIKFRVHDTQFQNIQPEVAAARRLYAQFLQWAAVRGHPRDKSQTPEEYQLLLAQFSPENKEALDFITCEYVKVRYGSSIPTLENLNYLREKWQNLKKTGLKKSRN